MKYFANKYTLIMGTFYVHLKSGNSFTKVIYRKKQGRLFLPRPLPLIHLTELNLITKSFLGPL